MAVQRAEALFDFEPTADVELELKKGDIVLVRRVSVGEGWWEGELYGRRGLFPSSFVKLLPLSQGSPAKERPITPITPRTSKKMFMDALLAPDMLTQEQLYDRDKAAELFTPGHADIGITVGPAWDCDPPQLTVAIRHMQSESRFSGMKHTMVYEVETEQLGTRVARRYRHFLWLYDKMAELFPCLSLPPLPVKHFSGLSGMEENEARRRGLEKFLIRIARHPVLASTKLFREFLTAKDEKDWKIGRHLSKVLKSKKMFSSPFYYAVKYPPFNVPVNQLSSIEKFSRFSRFMESTVQTIHQSCTHLTTMNSDAVTCLLMLGRDFQRFSSGRQPASGAWIVAQKRKHAAANPNATVNGPSPFHVSSVAAVASQRTTNAADKDEGSSDEELFDTDAQWYWRDDKRFAQMAENLHDLGGRMRKFKPLLHVHQEAMERQVKDTLDDYSGIIHTLPMLVKLHEEAMEVFNSSREKDSKKDAEEIRQHCDTLNNILLAEFDYFSKTMIDDFEVMTARLLKQQADFHRRLADELEALCHNYTARTFTTEIDSRNSFCRSRSTSGGSKKSASFLKSGSIDLTSSQESTSSELFQRTPTKDNFLEASQSSQASVQTLTTPSLTGMATYINVELKQKRTAESSGSEIDEDILKPPSERGREREVSPVVAATVRDPSPSPPPQLPPQSSYSNEVMGTAATDEDLMPTPFDDPLPDLDTTLTFTDEIFSIYDQTTAVGSTVIAENDTQEEVHDVEDKTALLPPPSAAAPAYHNYANLEFIQVNNLLSQTSKQVSEDESTSPKGPKKPMPIQRKTKGSTPQSGGSEEGSGKATTNQESPVRNPLLKKPAPPVKPSYLMNQDSDSLPVNSPKVQAQQQQTSTPSSSSSLAAASLSGVSKPHPPIPALSKFLASATAAGGGGRGEERARDDSVVSTGSTSSGSLPPASTKPRSHTTMELHSAMSSTGGGGGGEKKQPILPPATRYRSKSRSPSPVVSPSETTPQNRSPQQQQPLTQQTAAKEKKFDEDSTSTTKESNKIVLAPAPALAKKPVLKPMVSEPGIGIKNRPVVTTAMTVPALNRANKPTHTSYGSKFPRPLGGGVSDRANHTPSSNSNNEQDELMKKLTLRRLKIDEQLGAINKSSNAAPSGTTTTVTKSNSPVFQKHSPPSTSPQTPHRVSAPLGLKSAATVSNSSMRSGETSSERNSTISTSSSEVIVAYRKLDESPSMTSLSSNGTSHSMDGGGSGGPLLRKPDEGIYGNETKEMNLAKYGIIEEGGSYII